MRKKVRLTWVGEKGHVTVEECYLISEDEPVYTLEGDEVEGIMPELISSGRVLFEDSESMFGLFPKQIVNIEIL